MRSDEDEDMMSGHDENRRFFEEQMARATGSIKATNTLPLEQQNPRAYQDKADSNLRIGKRHSQASNHSKRSTISVQMEDVETGNKSKVKKMNTSKINARSGSHENEDYNPRSSGPEAFANRLAVVSAQKQNQSQQNFLNVQNSAH